jgi:hypothetical protein
MLQKIGFMPGFNKQVTPTTAEGQWIAGDNVRFRYSTPEKIGGWAELGESYLTGPVRAIHHFVDKSGIKYAALGTNRILYIYSGGIFYDIHPIKSTTTLTNAFSTVGTSPGPATAAVTITFPTPHGINVGDIILLDGFTTITGSNYVAADFDDKKFMVTTVPTTTTLTITMPSVETGAGATTSGGIRVQAYYPVGPAQQLAAYGWGIGQYSGTVAGEVDTTLNGALLADTAGTGGVGTSVTLTSTTGFPATGLVLVGAELISYTGITGNDLTGITRGASGTAVSGTTGSAHLTGATVYDANDYVGWGEAASGDYVIEPGMWSLDNYGTTLIALIVGGSCFEWDSSAAAATSTRATIISGAPTASRDMLVSTPDRHLVFFGTETTIGDTSTQDDMFIRFSSQESLTDYTPTAINTAGTQRLADGSKIMGALRGRDALYIWTDTAMFTMRFVGAPFTFAYEQVGTNCGLIGKNACVEVDGAAYWMSENGFFNYTGQLVSMDCLVEDFVYDDINTNSNQLINAGLNNLFGEVMWFYCTAGSNVVDAVVSYNYIDSSSQRGIWTTGSLNRTAWADSAVFGKPHATYYDEGTDTSFDVVGNTDGISTYYEQETGNNQILRGVSTAITSNIESGDFDITQDKKQGITFRGDGEYFMSIRRFIPDFLTQTGTTRITLYLRDYPNQAQVSSTLGPFDITSSTTKQDTRARARSVALKVENTAVDETWKLGTFRLDIQESGRR